MPGFEPIQRDFWTHPKIRALTPNGRYVTLLMFSCPDLHGLTGTGQVDMGTLRHYTGMRAKQFAAAWQAVEASGIVSCYRRGWVWVPNKSEYTCSNANHWRGVVNYFTDSRTKAPLTLVRDYLEKYDHPALDGLRQQTAEKGMA